MLSWCCCMVVGGVVIVLSTPPLIPTGILSTPWVDCLVHTINDHDNGCLCLSFGFKETKLLYEEYVVTNRIRSNHIKFITYDENSNQHLLSSIV